MLIESAWAQADGASVAVAGSALPGMIFSYAPLLLIIVVFYLLVIRPQSQQAKEHAAMLKKLLKGDVIETSGGIVAVVMKADEKFLTVSSNGTELVLARGAVARKLSADEAQEAKPAFGVKK